MVEDKATTLSVSTVQIYFTIQQTSNNTTYMESQSCTLFSFVCHLETLKYLSGILVTDTTPRISHCKSHHIIHDFIRQCDITSLRMFAGIGKVIAQYLLESLCISTEHKRLVILWFEHKFHAFIFATTDTLYSSMAQLIDVCIRKIEFVGTTFKV